MAEIRELTPDETFNREPTKEEIRQEQQKQEDIHIEESENLENKGEKQKETSIDIDEEKAPESIRVNRNVKGDSAITPETEPPDIGKLKSNILSDKTFNDGQQLKLNAQKTAQNLQTAKIRDEIRKALIYLLLGGPATDVLTGGALGQLLNGNLLTEKEQAEFDKALVFEAEEPEIEKITGTVKYVNKENQFGFIEREDGSDLYFNAKNMDEKDFNALNKGDKVEFDIASNKKGDFAINVTKAAEEPTISMAQTPQGINVPNTIDKLQQADISQVAKEFMTYMLLGGPLTDVMTGGMLSRLVKGELFDEHEQNEIVNSIVTNEEVSKNLNGKEFSEPEIHHENISASEPEFYDIDFGEEFLDEDAEILNEQQEPSEPQKEESGPQKEEVRKNIELDEKKVIDEGRQDLAATVGGVSAGIVKGDSIEQNFNSELSELKLVKENPELLSQTHQTPAMIAIADGMPAKEAIMQYGVVNGTREDAFNKLSIELNETELNQAHKLDMQEFTSLKLESFARQELVATKPPQMIPVR